MKRSNFGMVLAVSLLMLVLVAGAYAGDGCGSKSGCGNCKSAAKVSMADCPAGCCTPEECGMTCADHANCKWDHTQWKSLRYDEQGLLKQDLTPKQAKQVVKQYLKKQGLEKAHVVEILDNPKTYTVVLKSHKSEAVQKLNVAKKNAAVRSLDA